MSAERMVMAYGDNGLELTPESEVVEIRVMPLGPGNVCIPATVEWASSIREGGIPLRLREVRQPTPESKHAFVYVSFDCTPFVRCQLDSGPVYGEWSSCSLRNASDATHPIFSRLSPEERSRLLRAVEECEASRGLRH